jgi:hypothetical protein
MLSVVMESVAMVSVLLSVVMPSLALLTVAIECCYAKSRGASHAWSESIFRRVKQILN